MAGLILGYQISPAENEGACLHGPDRVPGSSPFLYEFSNDATQMRLANKAHGLSGWIPSNSAFALFRPTLVLARHTKGEYLNATARLVTFFENLVVWI